MTGQLTLDLLDFTLLRIDGQAEEVETVRVLQRLTDQVGMRFGRETLEVTDRLATAFQQTTLDLHHQNVARPVVLNGLGDIPAAGLGAGQLVQQHQIVAPGQLCSSLLHKFRVRPRLGKRAHVFEIAW